MAYLPSVRNASRGVSERRPNSSVGRRRIIQYRARYVLLYVINFSIQRAFY